MRGRHAHFEVIVTRADGTRVARTLTQLGIPEIDLHPDTTQVALPDGSCITGQSNFVIGGVRRTAADMVLMADAQGFDVTELVATAGKSHRTTLTGVDDSGDVAYRKVVFDRAAGARATSFETKMTKLDSIALLFFLLGMFSLTTIGSI